jgi:hypothetical protein
MKSERESRIPLLVWAAEAKGSSADSGDLRFTKNFTGSV